MNPFLFNHHRSSASSFLSLFFPPSPLPISPLLIMSSSTHTSTSNIPTTTTITTTTTPAVKRNHHGISKLPRYRLSAVSVTARSSNSNAPPLTVTQSLICGALARAAQIIAVFPIDTIKTRLQSSSFSYSSRLATSLSSSSSSVATTTTSTAMGNLTRAITQGRFYSGVGVTLTGQVPYAMLTFGIYETIRSRLPNDIPNWLGIMLSAGIGDAIGSLWLTPSEVIKSKTQTGLYSSTFSAVRAIATTTTTSSSKNLLSSVPMFYQGYIAALARDVPFRAIQMFLYEQCRFIYMKKRRKSTISALENLFVGAISGSITAFVTNPVDVIRTRVMSQPVGEHALYKNALDCIVKTVQKEGLLAFFKGAGARTLMVGPASAIFFLTYEGVKSFYRNRTAQQQQLTNRSNSDLTERRHLYVMTHHHRHQKCCPRRPTSSRCLTRT